MDPKILDRDDWKEIIVDGQKIKVLHEQDDPLDVLRVSAGGKKDIGFYFVYRGSLEDIKYLVNTCAEALQKL
jgi:hypothetical protein